MKKTSLFRLLAKLFCILFLCASLNLDSCKNSQPTAPPPPDQAFTTHFSSIAVSWNLPLSIAYTQYSAVNGNSNPPIGYDRKFVSNSSFGDSLVFFPNVFSFDSAGGSSQWYDSLYNLVNPNGDKSYQDFNSIRFNIDTISKHFRSITFGRDYEYSYDGGSCNSCAFANYSEQVFLKITNVPYTVSSANKILARLSGSQLVHDLDSIALNHVDDYTNSITGIGGARKNDYQILYSLPPDSNSYVQITFTP
jgi:hypothetical protein